MSNNTPHMYIWYVMCVFVCVFIAKSRPNQVEIKSPAVQAHASFELDLQSSRRDRKPEHLLFRCMYVQFGSLCVWWPPRDATPPLPMPFNAAAAAQARDCERALWAVWLADWLPGRNCLRTFPVPGPSEHHTATQYTARVVRACVMAW